MESDFSTPERTGSIGLSRWSLFLCLHSATLLLALAFGATPATAILVGPWIVLRALLPLLVLGRSRATASAVCAGLAGGGLVAALVLDPIVREAGAAVGQMDRLLAIASPAFAFGAALDLARSAAAEASLEGAVFRARALAVGGLVVTIATGPLAVAAMVSLAVLLLGWVRGGG